MLPLMRRLLVLIVAALVVGIQGVAGSTESPAFHGSVSRIDPATRKAMIGSSWHKGCPVAIDSLRLVRLNHWGFDGKVHRGEMIVRRAWAKPVLSVFAKLFRARFPMHKIALADLFQGDDHRLMNANVTSGFNCRSVQGHPGVWSEHAYGRAIDINPVRNPYVTGKTVLPPAGKRYLDRTKARPGMIVRGRMVVRAFAGIGWGWGGNFHSLKDYMHFSATGR